MKSIQYTHFGGSKEGISDDILTFRDGSGHFDERHTKIGLEPMWRHYCNLSPNGSPTLGAFPAENVAKNTFPQKVYNLLG